MFSSMFFEEEICIYEALLNVYKKEKYWTISWTTEYFYKIQNNVTPKINILII